MEYDRTTWFPNGLDPILLQQEILTGTKLTAIIEDGDPVKITTPLPQLDLELFINNHNPPIFQTDVPEMLDFNGAAFMANTNAHGGLYPQIITVGPTFVRTEYRPNHELLLTAVHRHKAPYYYQAFSLDRFQRLVLNTLVSNLQGLAFFVRAEIDGNDLLVYTNQLVTNDSIETIIDAYIEPTPEVAPVTVDYTYADANLPYDIVSVNWEQLYDEIEVSIDRPVGHHVYTTPDDVFVDMQFSAAINQVLLDPIMQNHVAQPYPIGVDLEKDPSKDIVNIRGETISFFGSQSNEIVIDKNGQGQFTTIKEAIAYYNSTGSTSGAVFILRPGKYFEDNPLLLPARCNLASKGSPGNTEIYAINQDQNLIVLNKWTEVYNVSTYGPTAARAFLFDSSPSTGSFASLQECVMYNAMIGLECTGDNTPVRDALLMDTVLIMAATSSGTHGIYIHDGGYVIAEKTIVTGNPGVAGFNTAIECRDLYSSATMNTATLQVCTNGAVINGGFYQSTTSAIQYNGVGMTVGPNAGSRVFIHGCEMTDNQVLDFLVTASQSKIELVSIGMDENKISIPNGFQLNANQYSDRGDVTHQYITGNVSIGSALRPTPLYIGGGDSHTIGMTVKLLRAAVYSSLDPETSIPVLTGDEIYIGRLTSIAGIHIDCTGTYAIDKFNGVAWEETQISETICYVQLEPTTESNEVDGQVLHWVRVRITADGTLNFLRFATNSVHFTANGHLLMLGSARTKTVINSTLNDWIGHNTAIVPKGRVAAIQINIGGYISWVGSTPPGHDQSMPIKVTVSHDEIVDLTLEWGYFTDLNTAVGTETTAAASGTHSYSIKPQSGDIWMRIQANNVVTVAKVAMTYYMYKLGDYSI